LAPGAGKVDDAQTVLTQSGHSIRADPGAGVIWPAVMLHTNHGV